ncbi:unnamed protein product [Alopecurus aequalis]
MDDATNPGGAGWSGGWPGGGSVQGTDAGAGTGAGGVDDELEDLWPARRTPTATAMLAQIWAANPATSEQWTYGIDGVDLDPEIWEVRIHFDGLDNIERRIGRDDVTYLNVLALIATQGYGIRDSLYCRKGDGMVLVDSNAKMYELLDFFAATKVLAFTVKRGRGAVNKNIIDLEAVNPPAPSSSAKSIIRYADPVVYDLDPPPVYVVNNDGRVFASQCGSVGTQSNIFPNVCTQESVNVPVEKGKAVQPSEEEDDDVSSEDEGTEFYFDMGEVNFAAMAEMKSKEDLEIAERIEERRKVREDPVMHCEGDTDIEDLFVTEDEPAPVVEPETEKKKKKLNVRRGPTLKSHSSVQVEDVADYKPEADLDNFIGYLGDQIPSDDDDGFEPLSMVPPKGGRKSRAKKVPPRKWYDENRLNPHEQLCLKMCFTNCQQVRKALINLHIAQSRNYRYHRNSNERIIVQCIKDTCPFFLVASWIKGEKTFAKWLAENYEGMFRSDPNTSIQSLIDSARQQHGVEVPKQMAYRAKNLALDAVLGDHGKQYHRLGDFAQTVQDTNPGSRVIVTTVSLAPSEENPHPGPTFHGLYPKRTQPTGVGF